MDDLTLTDAFIDACWKGNAAQVAQFLEDHAQDLDVHWNGDSAFVGACGAGSTQMIVWLRDVLDPDLHSCGPRAFTTACELGNHQGVSTLWALGVCTDAQAIGDGLRRCLRMAASYDPDGRVECLQTLWSASYGTVDIHENLDWMFKEAVDCGHPEVLAWVRAKGGPDAAWPVKVGVCDPRWEY